jgi:hypothetical protein
VKQLVSELSRYANTSVCYTDAKLVIELFCDSHCDAAFSCELERIAVCVCVCVCSCMLDSSSAGVSNAQSCCISETFTLSAVAQ